MDNTPPLVGLHMIARWAQAVAAGRTLGDALDAVGVGPLPDDVAQAVESLRAVPLDLITRTPSTDAFRRAFEELLARAGSDRELSVLRGRLSLRPQTLAELAVSLGVSRERVRQVQRAAEQNIKDAATGAGFEEVVWRAQQLHNKLGAAARFDSHPHVQGPLTQLVEDLPEEHREMGVTILLWLAGPYRYDKATGWIHAGAVSEAGPPASRTFLSSLADGDGRIDRETLASALNGYGFSDTAQVAWLAGESHIREIAGSLFRWDGTVADKAAAILLTIEEPATADELTDFIGEGNSVRSLRGRLLGDERFVRTDRVRVGLRAWGLEEYTGIVDEIGEEIDARGGDAAIAEVVSTVAKRFELRIASVDSYSTVPRFVVAGDRIRRRGPDEPYVPDRAVVDEAGCYVLDDRRCVLRLRIDHDVLRGSGRQLPQGLGSWLGVLPGAKRRFHVDDSNAVLVSWPDSALMGPSLGSIRSQVEAAAGSDGDYALLTFDRTSDTLHIGVLTPKNLEGASNWRRLQMLSGIEASNAEQLEALLGNAVGATRSAPLQARLRLRGESELSELFDPHRDAALDDALDRLKAVL